MVTTTYHSPLGDITLIADERGLTGLQFVDVDGGSSAPVRDARPFDMHTGAFEQEDRDGGEAGAVKDEATSPMEEIAGGDACSGSFGMTSEDARNASAVSVLERAWAWLNAYFAGQAPRWTPPLHIEGTEFHHAVWVALLEVPYGQTVARGELMRAAACRCGVAAAGDRGLVEGASGHDGRDSQDAGPFMRAVDAAIEDNPIAIIVPCHRVVDADGPLANNGRGSEVKRALRKIEGQVGAAQDRSLPLGVVCQ